MKIKPDLMHKWAKSLEAKPTIQSIIFRVVNTLKICKQLQLKIMNSYATLTFIYTLFTLTSSSILYASFRKKLDASAIYFLISELCMAITCGILFLLNINIIDVSNIWTCVPNFTAMGAELAILFSILSLTKKIEKIWFFIGAFLIASIAIALEIIRPHVELQIVVLLLSASLFILFTLNYFICKFRLSEPLLNNQFMKWFTWLELGMVGYGAIRLLGYFFGPPIVPRDTPSNIALIVFSIYVVVGTFRYISYIGLRITWVDPSNPSQNPLNNSLANAIAEKDQLLRGLIASNRVIGISALASSLAHQLSQPLTTIALRADTTRRDLVRNEHDPKLIASLDEIANQSTKLSELVKSLRHLFGARSYKFAPVNLQKIIEEIVDIVKPGLEAKKISLYKDYQGEPVVYGDGIQIQQVLINVFNNAIDALVQNKVEDKKILISITNNEEFATLKISDTGGGISLELLPSIFELYKTTKQGGLGVGLWLSKVIMERHNGSITAFNDTNGNAVFKIEIPMHHNPRE
ncbi:sensor histidine kinase [Polynucleobacter sp. AP-Nino-20-G2]|uniref:sensor histidine kinase n=1 Tax=Polynucleobacter sp. AP-Nino-20-G2 TaxID=2576917 RepID=UPI001BFDFEAA|nr:ATP-binding protein [Polynucleobacter sp. AP-Nino-20-G2]QWE17161.1 hypothetical protein FD960_02770 [Polynucleobacter sp. AP-Nino-20-G2]